MRKQISLKDFMKEVFPKETKLRKEKRCPFCEKPINPMDWRDGESFHEFEISGLCQKCQDKTFNVEEKEDL